MARACARGDEPAWEEFRRRYFTFLRAFAQRVLPGAAGTDLADQVIADLWQRGKIARFDGRSTLKTWLGAVVAHAASNAAQKERRHLPLEDAPAREALRPPDDRMGQVALAALVAEATKRLAAPDRLLLLLYYDQGLTLDEMGALLHRSKAVLSRRLRRVTTALRGDLDGLARVRYGTSARELAPDLGSLELDLARLLATQQKGAEAVKQRGEGA
ncbi:MAG TPA: sigma-70 family RNA polymerase sigma factor [Thermoanaerobaculia bacterium]